jgi:hypothetical protein
VRERKRKCPVNNAIYVNLGANDIGVASKTASASPVQPSFYINMQRKSGENVPSLHLYSVADLHPTTYEPADFYDDKG